MATKNFTITYTASSALKLAVFRVSDGYVLDFADNTFKSTIGGSTTPYTSGTELTNAGGTGRSAYAAAVDLSHLNSSGTPADFLIDWYTDTALDLIVSETEPITVTSSDIDRGTAPTAAAIRGEIDANSTQLAAIIGYIDTEVAAIKTKTDNLPADPADASDIAGAFATVNSTLATIAAYVDTEIGAIKTVTDHLGTALELDGSVYRFTANALEQSPGGNTEPQIGVSIADDGTATIIGHLERGGVNVELASGSMAVVVTEDSSGSPVSTFSGSTSTVIDDHYFSLQHALAGLTAGEAYTFKITITDDSANTYTRTFAYGVH